MPNIMKAMFRIFFIIIILKLIGCKDKSTVRTITWTGTQHTISDTITFENDTQYVNKDLYLGHLIIVSDTGCILISRKLYTTSRQIHSLTIKDSLKEKIFKLAFDSEIINFNHPEDYEPIIYSGFNYLLSLDKRDFHKDINYLPPAANNKLKELHKLFESIWKKPTIENNIYIDTLMLDSLIFEKVKGFRPEPPLRTTIKFQLNP